MVETLSDTPEDLQDVGVAPYYMAAAEGTKLAIRLAAGTDLNGFVIRGLVAAEVRTAAAGGEGRYLKLRDGEERAAGR